MNRRLLNVLAVLSVLPCMATVAASARGRLAMDILVAHPYLKQSPSARPDRFPPSFYRAWRVDARNYQDAVGFAWGKTSGSAAPARLERRVHRPSSAHTSFAAGSFGGRGLRLPGVRVVPATEPGRAGAHVLVKHRALLAVGLLLPATLTVRRLVAARHRRDGKSHCPRCAYDLRATPERCRECNFVQ